MNWFCNEDTVLFILRITMITIIITITINNNKTAQAIQFVPSSWVLVFLSFFLSSYMSPVSWNVFTVWYGNACIVHILLIKIVSTCKYSPPNFIQIIHICFFSHFFILFCGHIMYILQLIPTSSSLPSQFSFHAVLVKSNSHTHTGAFVPKLSCIISSMFPYYVF